MFLAIITSFGFTWLTITLAHKFRFGADEASGVQKFHSHWVPRLGGVSIFISMMIALLADAYLGYISPDLASRLIVCLLPAFGIGLLEDITRRAGVLPRLIMTMVAAAIGYWLLDAQLNRVGIMGLDPLLLAYPVLAFLLTLFAAGGVAHAVNLIDGYNGLSGFFSVAAFIAMAWVAHAAGDSQLAVISLIAAAAVSGFLFWNFPFGRIFLGDAGAYLIGFLLAELAILLVHRNPEVSPWSLLLIMIYPIWETVFTILRRMQVSFSHIGQPDALHLHQLIYRRVMKRYQFRKDHHALVMRNSLSSVYLWCLILMSVIPGAIFWNQSEAALIFVAIFVATYGLAYTGIVRFKVPRWLVAAPRAAAPEKLQEGSSALAD